MEWEMFLTEFQLLGGYHILWDFNLFNLFSSLLFSLCQRHHILFHPNGALEHKENGNPVTMAMVLLTVNGWYWNWAEYRLHHFFPAQTGFLTTCDSFSVQTAFILEGPTV